jgi:hypothetical protein
MSPERGVKATMETVMELMHVVFWIEVALLIATMIAVTIMHDWLIIKSTWAFLTQHSAGRNTFVPTSSA